MENASKALIIAGSMLITLVVVSILVFGWSKLSTYYKTEEDVENIQQIVQKNKELESYNKEVIRGYELRSLANLIFDINSRYSEEQGYEPITAKLILKEPGTGQNQGGNIIIKTTKAFPYKKNNKQESILGGEFYKDNKADTLCIFMLSIYDKEYATDKDAKKTFDTAYFRCTEMNYNGEIEAPNKKDIPRVQNFKFEQI